jgi:DNA-binding beta-propeller fold protein YncE
MKTMIAVIPALLCAGWSVSWGATKAGSGADYELVADYKLGSPNFWDYLTYDPGAHRLYAAHINKIDVIDTNSGKTLGQVGPLRDAHGVAIVTEAGKGYADSGDDGIVKVFSLADLHVIKTIKVSEDADGMVYDPSSKTVLVVAGDSKNLTMIDVSNDQVVKTVALPGKPEFFAVDEHGHAFINLADTNSLSKVDLSKGVVTATWKLEGCEDPHGIAYDSLTNRLFSGCANRRMVVVDADSGKGLANLPIGDRSDSIAVDSTRHRAFSANADGTLTVVSQGDNDTYTVQRTVPTFFGGRNMAIDAKTGTLFIAHGNMKLVGGTKDLTQLRFGWDGLDVAVMKPND